MVIVSEPPAQEQLLMAALAYVRRGWRVLPCHSIDPADGACTCGKADCTSPGKHPLTPNGVKRCHDSRGCDSGLVEASACRKHRHCHWRGQ